MINIRYLHEQLTAALIPIIGISNLDDTKPGLSIQYAPGATQQQIDAGNAILAAFDIAAPTPDEATETTAKTKFDAYRTRLTEARNAMQTKLETLTGGQVDTVMTTLTNWTPGSAVTAAKADALYVAVAALYVALFYLLTRQRL